MVTEYSVTIHEKHGEASAQTRVFKSLEEAEVFIAREFRDGRKISFASREVSYKPWQYLDVELAARRGSELLDRKREAEHRAKSCTCGGACQCHKASS